MIGRQGGHPARCATLPPLPSLGADAGPDPRAVAALADLDLADLDRQIAAEIADLPAALARIAAESAPARLPRCPPGCLLNPALLIEAGRRFRPGRISAARLAAVAAETRLRPWIKATQAAAAALRAAEHRLGLRCEPERHQLQRVE